MPTVQRWPVAFIFNSDGMVGEYITVLLNTSLKGWNARWFYMKQSHIAIRYDADHIPESQKSWSERSSSADMEQVMELLDLIKGVRTNSGLVAASFIVCRIQPYKERGHAGYDFKGDTYSTREGTEMLSRDVVQERAAELFAPFALFNVSVMMRPFNYKNLPPQVTIPIILFMMLFIHDCCQAVN